MGNEQVSRMRTNRNGLIDNAVAGQAGLNTAFTQPESYLEQFYRKRAIKSGQRRKDVMNFIMTSYDETFTQKLIKYAKMFLIGGFLGFIYDAFISRQLPIQYFPHRKLEEYIGQNKRLSGHVIKYYYHMYKIPVLKAGAGLCAYLFLYRTLK